MTYEHAEILFGAMDEERQLRIDTRFELIRLTPGTTVRAAFAKAVDDEASAIEREMLLEQPTEGAA